MKAFNNPVLTATFKIVLAGCLFLFSGCAQAKYSVKDTASASSQAVLQDIKVSGSGDDTKVEITASSSLVYTDYAASDPPRFIVDLSSTDPGSFSSPQLTNSTLIKEIEIQKKDLAGGSLTRVIFKLTRHVEFSARIDASNNQKLVFSVVKKEREGQTSPSPKTDAATLPAAGSVTANGVGDTSTKLPAGENIEGMQQGKLTNTSEVSYPTEASISSKSAQTSVNKQSLTSATRMINALNVTPEGVEIVSNTDLDNYRHFMLAKPRRLVLDFANTKTTIAAASLPIGKFGIGSARLGIYPDKTRIVLDSTKPLFPEYRIEKTENGLNVIFIEEVAQAEPNRRPEAKTLSLGENAPVTDVPVTAKTRASRVESIDFKIEGGFSRISVRANGSCLASEPVRTPDGLVMTIRGCSLPDRLKRTFDTSGFTSVVKKIVPYQVKVKGKLDTKILVKMSNDAPFNFLREGNTFQLAIKNPEIADFPKPVAGGVRPLLIPQDRLVGKTNPEMQPFASRKAYSGRKITLEFADADVRKIFQLIAEVSNLNFILGDDVSGTISIKLVNVPWDQALDIILETKSLGMKRDGNIVLIRPTGKIQSLADEKAAETKALERAMEMRLKVYDINFAAVSDIATQFNALKSERGLIAQDSRTNRVIVTDIAPAIEKMTVLLAALDIPEKQVLIEARIIEASSNFSRDLGVQWGIHYKDGSASWLGINQLDTGFGGLVNNVAPASGFALSPGAAMGISFGKLTSNVKVDLRLAAAETTGQVKIISTPKIVTLNNKAAKILQGTSIPYQSSSLNEGIKTEFVEALLTLEVTPHITSDGHVSMKIKATNNAPMKLIQGTDAPPISKKEATTELLVKNGETTVIGGIYVDQDDSSTSGVPWLKDIPVLGWLFKSNTRTSTKTELLIFITPRIVS